jgi:hypothetical protein
MEMMDINIETIGKINVQWNNITNIKWLEKIETHSFCYEVSMYRDSSDTNPFFELSEFALKLLVLPWSNAEVERIFSQMNIIKTKTRNKTGTKLLNSMLTIKSDLKRRNTCCLKYKFPPDVLKKIGTLHTYNSILITSTMYAPNTSNNDIEYQEEDPNDTDELWI